MVILTSCQDLDVNAGGRDNFMAGTVLEEPPHLCGFYFQILIVKNQERFPCGSCTIVGSVIFVRFTHSLLHHKGLLISCKTLPELYLCWKKGLPPHPVPMAFLYHRTGQTSQLVSGFQENIMETLKPRKRAGSTGNEQTKTCNTTDTFVKVIHQGTATLNK